jgi:hypothetical protein
LIVIVLSLNTLFCSSMCMSVIPCDVQTKSIISVVIYTGKIIELFLP